MDHALLKANPFFLSDADIQWVEETLKGMTEKEKIGQLFVPVGFTTKEKDLLHLTKDIGIGGIMYRPAKGAAALKTHDLLQKNAKIPLLLAANLEAGGNGAASDGTQVGMPMGVAATNEPEMGYKMGKVACAEGRAIGLNWSFAPIVDVDLNYQSPITNLRTFGSDPDKIIAMAKGYMKAADEEGLAVSIKHFPGDGVDHRDQHLVTSVNSLSMEDWDATSGKVYQALINAGAKTVMVGHIAQPAYQEHFAPGSGKDRIIPATLSKALMTDLLRGKLGFNGVISTDATPMIGFMSAMKRREAVPTAIASGADVFLFNKDIDEDYGYMCDGVKNGIITAERLDEAVTRILALKASLKLHERAKNGTLIPSESGLATLNCPEHKAIAKECADKAITLVKDTQNLLPLSVAKHKRILLNVIDDSSDDINSPLRKEWKARLEKEGFEVTVFERMNYGNIMGALTGEKTSPLKMAKAMMMLGKVMSSMKGSIDSFTAKYDLVLYVGYVPTASNNVTLRIQFRGLGGAGNDIPWFAAELPVMFISLANPYHLQDVPMIKTYINAYTKNEAVGDAVMEKIMGRSAFKGVSPVDASCGCPYNMF